MTKPTNEIAADLAEGLATCNEMLAPVRAAAVGLRTQLVTDGWSPQIAESIAAAYLTYWLNNLLKGNE